MSENKPSELAVEQSAEVDTSMTAKKENNKDASIKAIVRVLMAIEKDYEKNITEVYKDAA